MIYFHFVSEESCCVRMVWLTAVNTIISMKPLWGASQSFIVTVGNKTLTPWLLNLYRMDLESKLSGKSFLLTVFSLNRAGPSLVTPWDLNPTSTLETLMSSTITQLFIYCTGRTFKSKCSSSKLFIYPGAINATSLSNFLLHKRCLRMTYNTFWAQIKLNKKS